MRVSEMGIKHLESATRLLDRDYGSIRGLDLSEEVLWVSVGQLASKLKAVRVGGLKKFCYLAHLELHKRGQGSIPGR